MVWDSKGQDGSSYGIYGQFYDPTGNAIGAEFRVNAHTVSSQDSPSVTGNSEGYFVTWESDFQDGSSSGIYGQFYDPAGNTIGTEFQLTYTAFSQRSPAVASAGANYLAVWKSDFQDG
ncbi:hypothetical protein RZS08_33745, partial [Arthrospira platensis SPKY1]|nr:hypothetical protein [Arthrospira platensis SPKY1]